MNKAFAFSNNDIAVLAWSYGDRLDGCLGFAIHRLDVHAGKSEALPAMAGFEGMVPDPHRTTNEAPVQKFWWKDLYARRGILYRYRIVPMGGTPLALAPINAYPALETNAVVLTAERGSFKAFFNRGIVASQAVAHALGTPSKARLIRHLKDPKDKLRIQLTGELQDALEQLLNRADDDEHAEIRGALYELNDPQGLELRLQASDHGTPSRRAIILGNERSKPKNGPEIEDADAENRAALKKASVPVVDRILPDQHIPHNKFLVLKKSGKPVAVLTGSTNWTLNALGAQTNNALIMENSEIAAHYQAYWDQLERDTDAATHGSKLQGKGLRDWVRAHNQKAAKSPVIIEGEGVDAGAQVHLFFAPSTKGDWHPKAKTIEDPADMAKVFELMGKAKNAILFLAFDPGTKSILDEAGKALAAKPNLFVRGALTSPVRAENFAEALKQDSDPNTPKAETAVIGEGDGGKATKGSIDFRAVPAGSVDKNDAFGAWLEELRSAGFAIIHDKIVVIDPFDDDCVEVTGSHNLGYRASHNNDENFVVVRGHRGLAEAYACHVLDIYDHYAWRWWLHEKGTSAGKPLDPTPGWQDRYFKHGKPISAELRFWLSAGPQPDDAG